MIVVKPNKSGIWQAVVILKKGGVIVYPTDTAYALGGIFNSSKVIKEILKIKKRKDQKFTLVSSSFAQVRKFFKLSPAAVKLARKNWPGPLSIVVSKRFAVRVPKNEVARKLARKVGRPIIATSANITGQQTIYDSSEIMKQFKNRISRPALIIDCGKLPKIKTSTVIKVKNNQIEIIRQGSVKI